MPSVAVGTAVSSAVSTTAVSVADGSPHRQAIKIKHVGTNSTASVYIGAASNVGTANGYELSMREEATLENFSGPLWAISNVAATPIRSFEVG